MKYWRPGWSFQHLLLLLASLTLLVGGGLGLVQLVAVLRNDRLALDVVRWLGGVSAAAALTGGVVLGLRLVYERSIRYTVDRNTISVWTWSGQQVIPLAALVQHAPSAAPEQRWGTLGRGEPVVLTTPRARYVLRMRDATGFWDALTQRQELGVNQQVAEGATHRWPLWAALRRDAIMRWSIGSTAGLMILAWGILAWRLPALPPAIGVRFDALGDTLGARPPTALFVPPLLGSLLLLLHLGVGIWLYRIHRSAGQMLLMTAVLLQASLVAVLLVLGLQ